MKSNLKKLIVVLFVFAINLSFAQCPAISDLDLSDGKDKWVESAQSRTETLKMGESFEMTFIAQRGMDYRIRVLSGAEDLEMKNASVRIYDTDIEKSKVDGTVSYKRTQKKVYDSNSIPENKEVILTTPKTRKLTVKSTTRKSDNAEKPQCIIVYIESRRSQKLGI